MSVLIDFLITLAGRYHVTLCRFIVLLFMRPFANGKIGLTSERVQEKPIEMLSGETVMKIASRATIFCVALRYHILIFYSYFCYYHTMQSLLLQDHSPTTNQLNHFLKIFIFFNAKF